MATSRCLGRWCGGSCSACRCGRRHGNRDAPPLSEGFIRYCRTDCARLSKLDDLDHSYDGVGFNRLGSDRVARLHWYATHRDTGQAIPQSASCDTYTSCWRPRFWPSRVSTNPNAAARSETNATGWSYNLGLQQGHRWCLRDAGRQHPGLSVDGSAQLLQTERLRSVRHRCFHWCNSDSYVSGSRTAGHQRR
jgi:hypothetical protein